MKTLITWLDGEGKEIHSNLFAPDLVESGKWKEGGITKIGNPTHPEGATLLLPHRIVKLEKGTFREEDVHIVHLQKVPN